MGVLAALVLVVVFGSPSYGDWARDNVAPDTAVGWFLRLLTWPSWQFAADEPVRDALAVALRAILVIVLTAAFLTVLSGPRLSRTRSTASQLLTGWAAYVFAGAAAGLLAAVVHSDPTVLGAFEAAAGGAAYGMFTGWIVGAATFAAPRRLT